MPLIANTSSRKVTFSYRDDEGFKRVPCNPGINELTTRDAAAIKKLTLYKVLMDRGELSMTQRAKKEATKVTEAAKEPVK